MGKIGISRTARDNRAPTVPVAPESDSSDANALLPPSAVQGFTIYDAMLLGMILTWAANPAAIKWALRYIDPLVFNALRFGLATLVPLGVLALGKENFRLQKVDWPRLVVLGLVGHGLYQVLFITAVSNTLAGNVALIISINPAFVAIFGAILGYERVRSYTWVGVALTLSGAALVVLGSNQKFEFGPRLFGDLLAVASTMIWGIYSVLSQTYLRRYSSVKLNAITMPFGAVLLLVVSAPAMARTAPSFGTVPGVAWLILALSGLLAVAASYIIWYKGIQKLGATRTSIYANLTPVLAATISYFVLGEELGWTFWAGMVLVISGVTLARFGGRFIKAKG